eukprot:COSAG02_NODE_10985_length_1818_cov_2.164631_1_plen_522_part_00
MKVGREGLVCAATSALVGRARCPPALYSCRHPPLKRLGGYTPWGCCGGGSGLDRSGGCLVQPGGGARRGGGGRDVGGGGCCVGPTEGLGFSFVPDSWTRPALYSCRGAGAAGGTTDRAHVAVPVLTVAGLIGLVLGLVVFGPKSRVPRHSDLPKVDKQLDVERRSTGRHYEDGNGGSSGSLLRLSRCMSSMLMPRATALIILVLPFTAGQIVPLSYTGNATCSGDWQMPSDSKFKLQIYPFPFVDGAETRMRYTKSPTGCVAEETVVGSWSASSKSFVAHSVRLYENVYTGRDCITCTPGTITFTPREPSFISAELSQQLDIVFDFDDEHDFVTLPSYSMTAICDEITPVKRVRALWVAKDCTEDEGVLTPVLKVLLNLTLCACGFMLAWCVFIRSQRQSGACHLVIGIPTHLWCPSACTTSYFAWSRAGYKPSRSAWCILVMAITWAVIGPFLGYAYPGWWFGPPTILLPLFMLFPFCNNECYDDATIKHRRPAESTAATIPVPIVDPTLVVANPSVQQH